LIEPPKRISKKEVYVDVTNYIFAVQADGQPCLLHMYGGGDDLYLAIFSTPEKLKMLLRAINVSFHKVVQITDARRFLESVALKVHVVIDPYFHEGENGKVLRYTELFLNN
jgi:hypothetical protein